MLVRTTCFLLATASLATCPAEEPPAWETDVRALLDGVDAIAAPGSPGTMAVWGKDAFPVVLCEAERGQRVPVVAAAKSGKGRLVGFAHDGYAGAEALRHEGTALLVRNAVKWVASGRKKARVGAFAGALAEFLKRGGADVTILEGSTWTAGLKDLDVLCLFRSDVEAQAATAVERFIEDGGGLLAGVTGWGWMQITRESDVRANPLNRIAARAGLGWTADFAGATARDGFVAREVPGRLTHGLLALETMLSEAPTGDLRQAAASAGAMLRTCPSDEAFRGRLEALAAKRGTGGGDPVDRFLAVWQAQRWRTLAPDQVRAHPSAASFPGKTPADAPAVARVVDVELSVPRWHSTGLYAVAGRPISVELPASALEAGLSVRIGCHSDALWDCAEWRRFPEVAAEFPLRKAETSVATPFGGLVYLVVPEGLKPGALAVKISGAVEAPLYSRGRTTAVQWKAIRARPAPWGELATAKVVLSIPSSCLRSLEDPEALLELWDRILDSAADLATLPHHRPSPERYVADLQISAGYMHSGYPIMTHLDAAPRMASLEAMLKGDWGLVHELGHNHQRAEWTFEGTGEVTNNLWSLYLLEVCCKIPLSDGHPALKDRAAKARAHIDAGADFGAWKKDPFLALTMYMQLQEAFGWDAFKRVFAEYRSLDPRDRPKTDDEKRDQWLVRFSRAVDRDLGPFFESWGVPVSDEARSSIADLEDWEPGR